MKSGAVKKETVDNAERFVFSEDGERKFASEYFQLIQEEWVVDVTEANQACIDAVKSIVLDTDYKFGPREGETPSQNAMRVQQMNDYPQWCEAFEAL